MVSISNTRLMVLVIVLLTVTVGWEGYVLATSAPSRSTNIEPGWSQACDFYIYLDGTTPVAHRGNGGINIVGFAGQDLGTFITSSNGLVGSNIRDCFESGTYSFSTQFLASGVQSYSITGRGNSTIFQAASGFPTTTDQIKFINCNDISISWVQIIGNGNIAGKTGGAGLSVQNCKQVTIQHVVISQAQDNGIWLCGDNGNVFLSNLVLTNNGNSQAVSGFNNGGLEIDANGCGGGPNDGVFVTDSIAFANFGPGFAVHNCGGSAANPCAAGKKPNTHIFFLNDLSYNNKNYGIVTNNGVGFGTYHWNDTSCINCKTYGNEYAGFFINGNTNGPLQIIGQADDTTPYISTATFATPLYVRIQIGFSNPSNTNMNGGAFASIQNNANITTSSGSYVSTAVGVGITPQITGKIWAVFSGTVSDSATVLIALALYRTTGAIPSAGSAVTGSQIMTATGYEPSANMRIQLASTNVDTGLTIGTAYNYYLAWAVTGGTGTLWINTGNLVVNEV